jgi:signal transduction histidine kinase/ActR/RegA family two-component response regulator
LTATELGQLLRDRRDEIVSDFVAEVRQKNLSPPGLARPLLVDEIPGFLDCVVVELARTAAGAPSGTTPLTGNTARRNAGQRWALGYDIEGLIREYGVLRHCVLRLAAQAATTLSIEELDALARCLTLGIAEAVTEYVQHRDQELEEERANLAFLAEAGQLLSSSLDYGSTLSRLTGLLVPRLADWCVVHLEGGTAHPMPTTHVDLTKVEALRQLYASPLPRGSPFASDAVVESGEPRLVPDLDEKLLERAIESPEDLALVRRIQVCSLMILPLRVQDSTFGALTLAYGDSRRHYAEGDLVLAGELARRAAVAIDNAKLYELSQQERSRVEAATRAKDEFVAMVSHELRTPLNAIIGWVRLMRGGMLDEGRRGHALEVIERNAQAQGKVVADLLDISRVITGKIRINPSQVDLSNVVDMVVEGVRPAADAKRIRIELDLDREQSVLRGDGERLQQAIWNLVANAVKFTPKSGRVSVRLRRVDSDLALVVEDDGQGIAPSFLPHVFETFRQSDASAVRSHSGLGVGLSIAKHIVELHGGSIEARSPGRGKGATFEVRLPVSPLVSSTLGISRVPATKEGSSHFAVPPGLEALRALVVDDEPDARELVAYVLETCGMEVRVAGSAAEAMAVLGTFTPHVVISDIGMPDEDGYLLIRSIRTLADEDKKNIPAIALTAFARNEDRTRALVAGFNMHMAKPVEPTALVRAVSDVAAHARR